MRGLAHIFPQDVHPFPRETVRQRWEAEFADPATRVYVAVDDGKTVVGFAATRGNELLHFGTAVHTWGTGVAQQLHDAVLDDLMKGRREPRHIRLRVFEDNTRARRFYERLGWTPTGERTRTTFPPHPVLVEYRRAVR